MKKYYRNTKISLLFLLISGLSWASTPVAVVNEVCGNVFVLDEGKTSAAVPGRHLNDFSEVIVEEGAQITFTDYHDHQFHLAGGGHVKLLNKIVELRGGYLWLQSYHQESDSFMIQTANAKISYTQGEAIVSFDQLSGRSQILAIKGSFEFGNLLQDYMKIPVGDGLFSFIQNDYENGSPRNATPIGEHSFNKVLALYSGIAPMDKKETVAAVVPESRPDIITDFVVQDKKEATRSIASVESSDKKEGKIIYVSSPPLAVEAAHFDVDKYYQGKLEKIKEEKKKKVVKKFVPSYAHKSGVQIEMVGFEQPMPARVPASVEKPKAQRAPASIEISPAVKINPSAFEKDLVKQYESQMRHSNETNELIQELRNFEQDYSVEY